VFVSLWSRLRGKVRTLGCWNALLFTLAMLLRRGSFGSVRLVKYYFVAQPVAHTAVSPGGAAARLQIHVADREDAMLACVPRPAAVITDRFAQGARCVIAQRDGELAGFIWLAPERYREDEVRCLYRWTPASRAAWDFDVFIAPAYRMSRLFGRLWARAHELLLTQGIEWTLSRIDAFNAESLAAHRRLGARSLGCGYFLVAGPVQLMLATVAPYLHLSLNDGQQPQLRFDVSNLQ
jgi:hypothetical protein